MAFFFPTSNYCCTDRDDVGWDAFHNSTCEFHKDDIQAPRSHANPTMPLTPPPPYDRFENGASMQPVQTRPYQQPYQSLPYQTSEPVRDTRKSRKKPSAWLSAANLSNLPIRVPHSQEQDWQGCANPTFRSGFDRIEECPITWPVAQGTALGDAFTARFYGALSVLDAEEGHDGSLEDGVKSMTLDETSRDEHSSGGIIDFKKTWLYANSRLRPFLPPTRIYISTWQIICAAAQASMDVYNRPKKDERQDYVEAAWRLGTKAMVVKSQPIDDKNLVVISIRGSKWNIVDWAVNFRPAPTEPVGFMDDEGNACHAGFLQVARAMIAPVAARLRQLIERNSSQAPTSLLITGHSAGGAVASLLYMHMMATGFESELNILTGCFKRVHCVTFGTPPLSFLPLQNPAGRKYENNVFMHFANEGDLVVRADRQYMGTLARIIAAPPPVIVSKKPHGLRQKVSRQKLKPGSTPADKLLPSLWQVPPAVLSNAARIVLLREKPNSKAGAIEAVQVTDEDLRRVVFGDPAMHDMALYRRRVFELATAAMTCQRVE